MAAEAEASREARAKVCEDVVYVRFSVETESESEVG